MMDLASFCMISRHAQAWCCFALTNPEPGIAKGRPVTLSTFEPNWKDIELLSKHSRIMNSLIQAGSSYWESATEADLHRWCHKARARRLTWWWVGGREPGSNKWWSCQD